MKELLEKLKSLDPTTYKRYSQFSQHDNIYDKKILEYLLQGVLQEAISGKGWQGILLFDKEHSRAVIEEIIDGWGGTRKLSEEIGNLPIEALLKAYIAACEANR